MHGSLLKVALVGGFSLALSYGLRTCADNWPNWRGPSFNGATVGKGVPEKFSKTENVLWTARMPGPAAATPIVWGKQVFISSVDQENKTLLAMCLDRADGKVLWQHEISP